MVLYLKNIIKDKLDKKQFSKEQTIDVLKDYIDLYLTAKISDQLYQNLNISLQDILNSGYIIQDNQIIDQLCILLNNYTTHNSENVLQFKPVVNLLQMIISCGSTNLDNITNVLEKIFIMIEYMINKINVKFGQVDIKTDIKYFLDMYIVY